MNSKTDIDQIISNFLSDSLTDFERQRLKEWKNESVQNAYQLDKLSKLWKERSFERKTINASDIKRKIWHHGVKLDSKYDKTRKQRFIHSFVIRRIAAAFIIFSILGILYLMGNNFIKSEIKMTDDEYVEKINPPGQKSKIFLSDGSVVWLNAKSSISYFKHFTDSNRIVTLEGEAFFDVAKDSLNPFIVRTNGVTIEVLGTQFNVNSRNSKEEVAVALVEGEVKVFSDYKNDGGDATIILPGEGIIISSQYDRIDNFSFDISGSNNPYSSWKDGILVFNGENYNEFITKIKLWYDIEVQANGIPPVDWDIRGNFPNETLDNIMKAISFNKEITYKIDRKKLMLNFN